jgi:hypothetical protein
MRVCSSDPVEDARLEEEYRAESLRVDRVLREKGFGIEGDEPPSVQVIRAQIVGRPDGAQGGKYERGDEEGAV